MKRISPSIEDLTRTSYIQSLGFLRRFERYWGTTTIGGLEVFEGPVIYWPEKSERAKKIEKLLKIDLTVRGPVEGVEYMYLYLNKQKLRSVSVEWDNETISDNLHKAYETITADGMDVAIAVGPKYFSGTRSFKEAEALENVDAAGFVEAFPNVRLANFPITIDSDDPYISLIALCLLSDPQFSDYYDVVDYDKSYQLHTTNLPYSSSEDQLIQSVGMYTHTLYIRLKKPAEPLAVMPPFGSLPIYSSYNIALRNTAISILSDRLNTGSNHIISSIFEYTAEEGQPNYSMPRSEQSSQEDRYWIRDRLRTDIFKGQGLKKRQALKYLISCIDQHYKKTPKKKRQWYDYLIAVVVIVLSVVLSVATGGASLAAGIGTWTAIYTIAVVVTLAVMYISIAAFILSTAGQTNIASALSQFLKNVEPLIWVATAITMINVVKNALDEAIKQALVEAGKEAAMSTVAKLTVQNLAKIAVKRVVENITFKNTVKVLQVAFELYQKNQLKKISEDIKSYRNMLAEKEEQLALHQTNDALKDFSHRYMRVLDADMSEYAELYDRPYEKWSTPYHTGNSQATTVNALWLT